MTFSFSNKIINWYQKNKRNLPWRNTKDPYKIWLSEIILQQTRVVQGLNYYLKFIKNYPTVKDLAVATEKEILNLWQGLGYYSRARNLHEAAKYICKELHEVFPNNYKDLKKLKGVGDYTAAAVASFAFDEAIATIDGNVYRVLSRYFNVDYPINETKGINYFKQLAEELLDKKNPYVHNQAIMEFGALQCKPKNPNCNFCPLNKSCMALAKNKVDILPIKIKKLNLKNRYYNYFVLIDENQNTYINERKDNDIWKGLYDFPHLKNEKKITENEVLNSEFIKNLKILKISLYNKKLYLYKLTHLNIYAHFWIIKISTNINLQNYTKTPIKNIQDYPLPRLIDNFVTKIFHDNF